MTIRFNRPALCGDELANIALAVESGNTSSSGPFSSRAEAILTQAIGAQGAVLTTSCTDALEMSAMLLDIGPGDVVIVPSFTFVSTALAFARAGATLRFCDIEPETLGVDPDSVASLMDDSVRAVVPVHYAGVGCDIDKVLEVAATQERCEVIEDNAHGLFGSVQGRPLGSFGRFSVLSFHETKNFTCGEGGALVLNRTEDLDRAAILRDKGTNRSAFFAGQVDKYTWVDTGSSFGLSEILAAYLVAQLEQRERVQESRRWLAERYRRELAGYVDRFGLELPRVPDGCDPAHHMFYVLMPSQEVRDRVMAYMRSVHDVHPTFHYVPLHSSPAGRELVDRVEPCPVSDDISSRLVRLPFFNFMPEDDADRVVEAVVDGLESV